MTTALSSRLARSAACYGAGGAAFSTRAMIKHRWVASEDLGEENATVIAQARDCISNPIAAAQQLHARILA